MLKIFFKFLEILALALSISFICFILYTGSHQIFWEIGSNEYKYLKEKWESDICVGEIEAAMSDGRVSTVEFLFIKNRIDSVEHPKNVLQKKIYMHNKEGL